MWEKGLKSGEKEGPMLASMQGSNTNNLHPIPGPIGAEGFRGRNHDVIQEGLSNPDLQKKDLLQKKKLDFR